MKTSLEKLDGLKRLLTVDLSIDIFRQKTDQILRKMVSKVNVNGFRKGKVPLPIMRKRFGDHASSDAVNEIVNDTLAEALAKLKITPVAQPEITKVDSQNQDSFSYTVAFEVYPEIQVGDFSKLEFEQVKAEITQADEDKTLQSLMQQATEYIPVKHKSKVGDQITIDFKGMINGKTFDGGTATDFKMILGKGSMIKGFEEALVGVVAKQNIDLDLTFPKQYHAPKLAGKNVIFEVKVKTVASPKTPELDDKFAEKFGEKNMHELKQSTKARMQIELDSRLNKQNKEHLFSALLKANDFIAPQVSINNEAQNLKQEMEQRLQQQGMPTQGDIDVASFNSQAERRVKLGLLVGKISSDNKLSADKEQIDAKIHEMAKIYGEDSQQLLDYYHADPARLASIELMLVEQMVQDLILASANVTIKQETFEEVTKR